MFNQFPCVLRVKDCTYELYAFDTWLAGNQCQIIHLMNHPFMGSPEVVDVRNKGVLNFYSSGGGSLTDEFVLINDALEKLQLDTTRL